ncbi:MAG: coiled-coil domain-containing protein [Planctomycetota bacterium]
MTRQENETDKTEKALAELRGKSAAMEEQLKTSTDAQKSLQIDIEDLNKMITAKEIELQSSQTEQLRLLERLEEMESSLAQQLQSTQALSDEKQALLNQLHKEQQAMTRSEAACRKLESEIKAQQQVYEQQLESAREDISAYQSHMDEAAENIQTLTLQLESLKEIEQLYHITLKDLESSKQDIEDLEVALNTRVIELDAARLSITEGLEAQRLLAEQLAVEHQQASRLSEQKTSLEFQIKTTTDTLQRVRNSYHKLETEHQTQRELLETERSDKTETIEALNLRISEMLNFKVSLEEQVRVLKKNEEHYHATVKEMQALSVEHKALKSTLEMKAKKLQEAESALEQTHQKRISLEEALSLEQRSIETLCREKEELVTEVRKTAERVKEMQELYQQHQAELEYRKRQFQQEIETKGEQIRTLQQRLSESTQQIHEFEPLLQATHEENSRLQQAMQKNAEEIAHLRGKIAEKNMEYTALQEKLAEVQNNPIELSDTPNDFENALMRIRLLTQDLEKETEFNQTARGELDANHKRIKKTEEQLAQKTEKLNKTQTYYQETKRQLAETRKELASLQRTNLNVSALEKKLSDANNRIENLSSQVKEQVESLKVAHQTINFLRAQKAGRSYKVPGLDSPGYDIITPTGSPKNIPD